MQNPDPSGSGCLQRMQLQEEVSDMAALSVICHLYDVIRNAAESAWLVDPTDQ
jgi:hypothetical protein